MRSGDKRVFNFDSQLDKRRELRNFGTSAEACLWLALKGSKLRGREFRRQHGIEKYIVDFYCPAEKLVIELDGGVHNDPIVWANDQEREARLKALGFRVLRFENVAVFRHLDEVLEIIATAFRC